MLFIGVTIATDSSMFLSDASPDFAIPAVPPTRWTGLLPFHPNF
jgi:hypothetical protein